MEETPANGNAGPAKRDAIQQLGIASNRFSVTSILNGVEFGKELGHRKKRSENS
jgi:hypothetical protein